MRALAKRDGLRAVAAEVVAIPGGWFRMGSDEGRPDERPVHDVFVTGFHLGRTPVTRAEYAPFLSATGTAPPPWWDTPAFGDPEQPVVGVTWLDAAAYCDWLGAECGGRWRLPSEAEWERAARGGLEGAATAWGTSLPPGEVPEGRLDGPWRVGRGSPNGFGLFDVGTVVHEWCLDWYGADAYPGGPARDPRGPAEGERRASRGGSWRHHVRWSPPSARSSLPPAFRYADYGFRVLREAD
jgi:formylglycine-generating enzyme required for sulfatase activity